MILSLVHLIRFYPEEVRVVLEDTGHYHWPVGGHLHLLNFTYRPEHSGEWGWITFEPNVKRPFLSRVAYPQLADEDLTYSTPYAKAVERIV